MTVSPKLDRIAAHPLRPGLQAVMAGNYTHASGWIVCRDGFAMSVISGWTAYCSPRPGWPFGDGAPEDYEGPFHALECGFPTERPEPWEEVDGGACWRAYAEDEDRPTDTVYPYVPVPMIRALLELHGGEDSVATGEHDAHYDARIAGEVTSDSGGE